MKKFLFSFILIALWAGTLYFLGQKPEVFPEAVRSPLERCSTSVQAKMSELQGFLADQGCTCAQPWSANLSLGVMSGLSFLGLWFSLAFLLGIKGFFRDLSAFFPLGK